MPGSRVTGAGGGLDNGGATEAGGGLELCDGKLTANNFNASWAEIEENGCKIKQMQVIDLKYMSHLIIPDLWYKLSRVPIVFFMPI